MESCTFNPFDGVTAQQVIRLIEGVAGRDLTTAEHREAEQSLPALLTSGASVLDVLEHWSSRPALVELAASVRPALLPGPQWGPS
jgi:hypothetical protein